MLRSTLPAHPDTNLSLHSISIGPASAARAASSKSLYRKRARASCSRDPLRRKRASDKALGLLARSRTTCTYQRSDADEEDQRNHRKRRGRRFCEMLVLSTRVAFIAKEVCKWRELQSISHFTAA
jgi:hypothetical protein